MSPDPPRERRFGRPRLGPLRDHLRAEIDALAIELDEAAAATESTHVPISARADYLRARDAHHRAATAWVGAREREQLSAVTDALRECRTALEASRALMRR